MIPVEPLAVGTFVEVWRSKIVSEVCVVTNSEPLILRKASPFERVKLWFKTSRTKKGELAAAYEAVDAIRKAKEGMHQ